MIVAFVPSYVYIKQNGSDILLLVCLIAVSLVFFLGYFYFLSREIKSSFMNAIMYSVVIAIIITIIMPAVFPFIWQWGETPKQIGFIFHAI